MSQQSIHTIKVAVPVPLRQCFDYLPPRHGPAPLPGMRCEVSFGNRKLIGVIWGQGTLDADIKQSEISKLKPITKILDEEPLLPADLLSLAQHAADYYHHPIGEAISTLLPTRLRQGENAHQKGELFWQLTDKGQFARPEDLTRAPRQQEALTLLQSHPKIGVPVAMMQALNIPKAALQALEKKSWVTLTEQFSDTELNPNLLAQVPLPASGEQQAAIDAISQATQFTPFLLEGITGSGKTEVYLQAMQPLLEQGKQVLVLVPEIGLTPQTVRRFEKRFNRPVAALHSGLTDKERLQAWLKARDGEAAIILGTRSAIFTPLAKPGLIIVDEAHDGSFKQQDGLRYSARDLAAWRAHLLDIPVVFGSATPALETLELANQGRYRHLQLTQRAGDAKPPRLLLEDCSKLAGHTPISEPNLAKIKATLERGEQALVFINRRGFAPVITCQDCGWEAMCRRCSARMTWHRGHNKLICHHCDSQRRVPTHCEQCHSANLYDAGAGTEKVEQQLKDTLADHTIIRIDRDATRRKGSLQEALKKIHLGDPAVLVGTQMLAKGHHFNNLSLAIVLDADSSFLSADFRGPEHGAQLILQVAGRTGREKTQGEVILQSRHPQLPIWQPLLSGDYRKIAEQILPEREAMGLPPYGHLAMIRSESLNERDGFELLQQCSHTCSQQMPSSPVMIMGPIPAPMERRQGRFRFQLLLMSNTRPTLHHQLHLLQQALTSHELTRRCRWHIDVDPTDMI